MHGRNRGWVGYGGIMLARLTPHRFLHAAWRLAIVALALWPISPTIAQDEGSQYTPPIEQPAPEAESNPADVPGIGLQNDGPSNVEPANAPAPYGSDPEPSNTEPSAEGADASAPRTITRTETSGHIVSAVTASGKTLWRTDLGVSVPATLVTDTTVYAAQGLYVTELNPASGLPQRRHAAPHPPVALEGLDEGVLVRFENAGPMLLDELAANAAPFALHLDAFTVLRKAQTPNDLSNPWTLRETLEPGLPASLRNDRLSDLLEAATPLPFFETAALVTDLLRRGDVPWPDLEPLATAAIEDMVTRGYDPRLVSNDTVARAYGLPYPFMADEVNAGRLDAGLRLAPWAALLASAEVPASHRTLHDLADALSRSGRTDEAADVRAAARSAARFETPNAGRALANRLAQFGWWGVLSLTTVTLTLALTLLAKVWPAQSFKRRQLKQQGRHPAAILRLTLVRHVATTEKLVILVLLLAIGAYASLAAWFTPSAQVEPVLQAGTFASDEALAAIEALPDGDLAAWMRGLHHAQRGDAASAEAVWVAAGSRAEIATNLAVIRSSPSSFEAALQLDPREPVARHALGRVDTPAPYLAFAPQDTLLFAVPSAADVEAATLGPWQDAIRGWWTAPWAHLQALTPERVPQVAATAIVAAWAALIILWAIFLVVPRPRVSRQAPRTAAYHALALVLPGAGHADELWGLLLLVPFGLFAGDLIVTATTASPGLGVSPAMSWGVLAGAWLANTVGFSVEWSSHRRRMARLKATNPELAAAFGLDVSRARKDPEDA